MASVPSGLIVIFLWMKLVDVFRTPTEIELEESEKVEVETEGTKKIQPEEYSKEKKSRKERGLFSSIFSSKEECDKCGEKLVYKEGAGSYYWPECQEYKWK